jgi:hypothetical protein
MTPDKSKILPTYWPELNRFVFKLGTCKLEAVLIWAFAEISAPLQMLNWYFSGQPKQWNVHRQRPVTTDPSFQDGSQQIGSSINWDPCWDIDAISNAKLCCGGRPTQRKSVRQDYLTADTRFRDGGIQTGSCPYSGLSWHSNTVPNAKLILEVGRIELPMTASVDIRNTEVDIWNSADILTRLWVNISSGLMAVIIKSRVGCHWMFSAEYPFCLTASQTSI